MSIGRLQDLYQAKSFLLQTEQCVPLFLLIFPGISILEERGKKLQFRNIPIKANLCLITLESNQ